MTGRPPRSTPFPHTTLFRSSSSFSDAAGAGTYWYGIHVFDNAGRQTNEPAPIKVTVTPADTTPPTVSAIGREHGSPTAAGPSRIPSSALYRNRTDSHRVET